MRIVVALEVAEPRGSHVAGARQRGHADVSRERPNRCRPAIETGLAEALSGAAAVVNCADDHLGATGSRSTGRAVSPGRCRGRGPPRADLHVGIDATRSLPPQAVRRGAGLIAASVLRPRCSGPPSSTHSQRTSPARCTRGRVTFPSVDGLPARHRLGRRAPVDLALGDPPGGIPAGADLAGPEVLTVEEIATPRARAVPGPPTWSGRSRSAAPCAPSRSGGTCHRARRRPVAAPSQSGSLPGGTDGTRAGRPETAMGRKPTGCRARSSLPAPASGARSGAPSCPHRAVSARLNPRRSRCRSA